MARFGKKWSPSGMSVLVIALSAVLCVPSATRAQGGASGTRVIEADEGVKLQVDGEDFMVYGMNWDYFPIGTNYSFNLWGQPDDFIEAALAREMPLLRAMGVNTIRVYAGMQPRWVKYIYERYGIYTIINHPMARYGFTLDGVWIPAVDYSDPRLRAAVKAEVLALVEEFRGTPGMLMWLLGNENNYGLSWSSFEIEALPQGERDAARARHLYSLFGEISAAIQDADDRPVAMCNGDVQYIDIIVEECKNIDVFGTNVYRGISARDLFQVVKDNLGVPVMFTEFGADAWNAKNMQEDQVTQARYLLGQWEEIYEQSAGKGRVGNAIGGLIFQWTDGWWKFRQEERLDIHDTNASWPNGGYPEDYVEGENNMNEEWWGITAKGPPNSRGLYDVYPRAAYYALKDAFRLDPYARDTDIAKIQAHFGSIEPVFAELEARGDRASLVTESLRRVRVSGLRMEFETYSTGGRRVTTPRQATPQDGAPSFRGFDRLESFYAEFEGMPADNVIGHMSLNVLGNVPRNPINEIFYENRGLAPTVQADGETIELQGVERGKVYNASVTWDDRLFTLDAFYRTGHLHWKYEGDFFGLYQDAYYGENIDIYNGVAPVGVEIAGKKAFSGMKVAFGPELWWGANPAVLLKYQRRIGRFDATAIYQEDLTAQGTVNSSFAVPRPPVRKATLQVATSRGNLNLEAGGIWSGSNKAGDEFLVSSGSGSSAQILLDEVKDTDALGAKARLMYQRGRYNWYAQAAYMGVVADGGPDPTITYTGWHLKDSGLGNQSNVLTGMAVSMGNWQIGPNVLYQKPLVSPMEAGLPPPGRPRNILDDPFAVRGNREMTAGELMLVYDPTPATWMWAWDNDVREDAQFAASLGFVYRHMPTTQDVSIGILGDGRTTFAFPNAPGPRDLWELHGRVVSKFAPRGRALAHLYLGDAEPNGDSDRRVHRYGGDARITYGPMAFETFVKFDDWGPYDYHRDFNLTFPLQLMADVSNSLGTPRWFGFPQTRFGVRGSWRSLDSNSPRYCPSMTTDALGNLVCDPSPGQLGGSEWEIRTYIHLAL